MQSPVLIWCRVLPGEQCYHYPEKKSVPLSAYARPMRNPGLTQLMVLSASARTRRCPVLTQRTLLPAYARATQSPVLTSAMLLPGCGS
eukprot:811013-Rhodomonas_salina.2